MLYVSGIKKSIFITVIVLSLISAGVFLYFYFSDGAFRWIFNLVDSLSLYMGCPLGRCDAVT